MPKVGRDKGILELCTLHLKAQRVKTEKMPEGRLSEFQKIRAKESSDKTEIDLGFLGRKNGKDEDSWEPRGYQKKFKLSH